MISSLEVVYVKFRTLPCTETKPTRLSMEVLTAPIKGVRKVLTLDDWLQKHVEKAGFRVLFEDNGALYAQKTVTLHHYLGIDSRMVSAISQLIEGL